MLLYHLRHALRRLRRDPGFTTAAVLTLALGVGANVAVFAVVEAVLLRPLPYAAAEELVTLRHRDERTGITKEFIAIGDFLDMQRDQRAFERVAGYGFGSVTVYGDGEPWQAGALNATPELLELLRVRPHLGRLLTREDGAQEAAQVVVLGHGLWQTRFGGDPAVLGRSIRIGQSDRTIVGVASPGFRFPPQSTTELIVNQRMPVAAPAQRKAGWTFALARLKPGRTLADAEADLATMSRRMATDFPEQNAGSLYYAQSLRDATVGNVRTPLLLLLAAVAVVLMIACANVANLLLARSLARRRELAVRMTLGAGRARLAVQLLAESVVLAVVAGGVGLALAIVGARGLVRFVPESAAPAGLESMTLNAPVLGFALGIVLLTALVCGVVGAFTTPDANAAPLLVGAGKTSASAAARRTTSGLVMVEIAMAVVLLIGAGLILRSFAGLTSVDPGFRTDGVLTLEVAIPADRYQDAGARQAFWSRALGALRATTGVSAAGAAAVMPLTGNNWTAPLQRDDQPLAAGERPPEVGWQVASGGYFRALEIPLVAGRLFDERDRPDGAPVVIVSEALARRHFADGGAVGKRIRTGNGTAEIIGVVGSIRRAGLRDEPRADLYFPFEQGAGFGITLFVRTDGDPAALAGPARAALREIEPNVVLTEVRTLAEVASESVRDTRFLLWLLGLFAATALALASVGIYGVMAYAVRQRTREIGTRIALGATRRGILWLVMRDGARIAVVGAAAGLLVGLAATRALQSMLYGVSTADPLVLAAAVGTLVATTLVACWIPARRAASVDPAVTLSEP